jgi:uncharacterized protein (TIGR04255 family)
VSKQLVKPHIIEALLELRCSFDAPLQFASLLTLKDSLLNEFPNATEQKDLHAQIDMSSGDSVAGNMTSVGFILTSKAQDRAMQIRIDGMRYSQINSYDGWEKFELESKRYWRLFANTFKAAKIEHIGLRFINGFELPSPTHLKEYFRTGPEVSPSLEQSIGELFFRIGIPIGSKREVFLTQFVEPPQPTRRPRFIFDIDASSRELFDALSDDVWVEVRNLREAKNRFFFESVTDKIISLCGGYK